MQDIILARIKDMEEAKARDEQMKLGMVDMVNNGNVTPRIISGKDMNVSRMSTNNTNEVLLLPVSTEDILQSKKDISVSTVSTEDNNEDILLEQTGDILQSLTGYNNWGGGGVKRKPVDLEEDELPPPPPPLSGRTPGRCRP